MGLFNTAAAVLPSRGMMEDVKAPLCDFQSRGILAARSVPSVALTSVTITQCRKGSGGTGGFNSGSQSVQSVPSHSQSGSQNLD